MSKAKVRKSLGERLIHSMRQAVDFAEGKDVPGIRVHIPPAYDVGKIRTKLKLSQREFARRYGFSIDSIQNWVQGRRVPDRSGQDSSRRDRTQSQGGRGRPPGRSRLIPPPHFGAIVKDKRQHAFRRYFRSA